MTRLFEILGTNVMSPEAAKELALYPALRREVDDDDAEPVRYLRSERDGLLIKVSDDGEVLTIFLMSEGKDGFAQFRGELPAGLSFSSTPGDVLKALGAPAYSRPPGKVGSFAHGDLLRFDRPAYSLHFQFRSDRRAIELVTAMVARSVPGRSAAPPEAP
ncbi:MAG TPA: hypothetical protein VFE23_00485 [Usitatibacter sp.]|nr:hypothetical protein [Usitatibacter sp.]